MRVRHSLLDIGDAEIALEQAEPGPRPGRGRQPDRPQRLLEPGHLSGDPVRLDEDVSIAGAAAAQRPPDEQAFDQLVKRARENRIDISREELERLLREDPRRLENAGLNDSFDRAFEIARAGSPEDILRELFHFGGAGSDGNTAMNNLLAFQNATARARNGGRDLPKDHPDSVFPGRSVAPTGCATS